MKIKHALCALIVGAAIGGFLAGLSSVTEKEIRGMEQRVDAAEQQLHLLHKCFPQGCYSAKAALECPAFRNFIMQEADRAEKSFNPEE